MTTKTHDDIPEEGEGLNADRDLMDKTFRSIRLIPQTIPTAVGPAGTLRLKTNGDLYISNGSAWVFLTPGAAGAPVAHAASHLSDGGDAIAAASTTVRGTVLISADNGTTAGTAVQASDSRLAAATNSQRGTVQVANNDESAAGKVILSQDTRLLTSVQKTDLTDGGSTILHVHPDAVPGVSAGFLTAAGAAGLARSAAFTATGTTPLVVTAAHRYLLITGTDSAPKAVTLPDPATVPVGFDIFVKDGATASVNNITITPAVGTIQGDANYVITKDKGFVHFVSNGQHYYIYARDYDEYD